MNERKKEPTCGAQLKEIKQSVHSYRQLRLVNEIHLTYTMRNQAASADKISSSAHHNGESLGVANSGDMSITCLNIWITSLIEGLL